METGRDQIKIEYNGTDLVSGEGGRAIVFIEGRKGLQCMALGKQSFDDIVTTLCVGTQGLLVALENEFKKPYEGLIMSHSSALVKTAAITKALMQGNSEIVVLQEWEK